MYFANGSIFCILFPYLKKFNTEFWRTFLIVHKQLLFSPTVYYYIDGHIIINLS